MSLSSPAWVLRRCRLVASILPQKRRCRAAAGLGVLLPKLAVTVCRGPDVFIVKNISRYTDRNTQCLSPATKMISPLLHGTLLCILALFAMLATSAIARGEAYPALDRAVDLYLSEEYEKAVDLLLPLAEAGDPDARFLLADQTRLRHALLRRVVRKGSTKNARRDLAETIKRWLKEAAESGHYGAMLAYTRRRAIGSDTPSEIDETFRWLELAASRGDGTAMARLGLANLGAVPRPAGYKADPDRGISMLEEAWAAGQSKVLYVLPIHRALLDIYLMDNVSQEQAPLFSRKIFQDVPNGGFPINDLVRGHIAKLSLETRQAEALKWLYVARQADPNNSAVAEMALELESKLSADRQRQVREDLAALISKRLKLWHDAQEDREIRVDWLRQNHPDLFADDDFVSARVDPGFWCPPPKLEQVTIIDWEESAAFESCMRSMVAISRTTRSDQ